MSRNFLIVLLITISLLFFTMIRSFLMALIMAGIFASLAQPLFRRLVAALRGHRSPASLLTLLIIVLLILVPLASLLGIVTAQALKVANSISPWVESRINDPDQLMIWLQGLPFYETIAPHQDAILTKAGEAVGFVSMFIVNNLSSVTAGTINFFFMLMIMLYAMYYFLIDGSRLLERIMGYLPLDDAIERRLLEKFHSVSRATLKGTAVIGILQGGLAGLAFWAVGLPSALFWGTIMAVLSIIPGVGTAIVWLPAAVILIAGGSLGKGLGLALFCGLVVGSVDNFLRPRLVGNDTQLPDLLVLLSTTGGLMMFGLLGFIIGPIIAALFVTVWEIHGAAQAEIEAE
jgi:predicted PurR-regulated permease PerM